MKINSSIFKEYDVRGIYPDEIDGRIAYKIGGAFVKTLKLKPRNKIVAGRDRRRSSKPLADEFIKSVVDAGIDVIDVGTVSTPMMYFAINALKTAGGAMITASHNSLKYNGIKFAGKNAAPIGGKEIKKNLTSDVEKETLNVKKGKIRKIDISQKYHNEVYKNFKPSKKNRVAHSFDFDGDRLMVRSGKNTVRGDIIGGIIADAVAKKGDIVVYDLRCSRAVPEYLRNKGVRPIPGRAGHFNIKKLMGKKKAVFGMEITGHYYFKKFNYCESPEFGLRKIMEQIGKSGKSLKKLAKPFMKYHHSGVMNFPAGGWRRIIATMKKEYKNGAFNFTDGITAEFSNWWFNLRPSHTEPLIRLVIEANSKKLLGQKKKEIISKIKK